MSFPLPRFEAVSRRHFLQSTALVGVAALVPAACSNDDKASLTNAPVATASVSSAPSNTGAPSSSAPVSSAVPADPAAAFPAGAQLQVNFSYNADGGDRVRNPYIAVWVETTAGEMVQTISLWLLTEKSRYLDHLSRWYDAETALLDAGGTNNLDAIAGATRGAGDYQVVWDGTDVDGNAVAKGDYVLCVEAAREHGPYELVSGAITIGDSAFDVKFDDNGELSKVSAVFVV